MSEQVRENCIRTWGVQHEYVIGTLATLVAVLMFASLGEVFLSNLRNDSVILIMPAITVLNGGLWCLYAYIRRDWFVFVPNLVAIVLGTSTVITGLIK